MSSPRAPVTLYLVAGQDPSDRLERIKTLLAKRCSAKVTLLANAEIFTKVPVAEQADLYHFDESMKASGVHLLRLAPGCVCCSSKLVFSTHISRTLRLNPPDWLILELDASTHLEKVRSMLTDPQWNGWFDQIHDV